MLVDETTAGGRTGRTGSWERETAEGRRAPIEPPDA